MILNGKTGRKRPVFPVWMVENTHIIHQAHQSVCIFILQSTEKHGFVILLNRLEFYALIL